MINWLQQGLRSHSPLSGKARRSPRRGGREPSPAPDARQASPGPAARPPKNVDALPEGGRWQVDAQVEASMVSTEVLLQQQRQERVRRMQQEATKPLRPALEKKASLLHKTLSAMQTPRSRSPAKPPATPLQHQHQQPAGTRACSPRPDSGPSAADVAGPGDVQGGIAIPQPLAAAGTPEAPTAAKQRGSPATLNPLFSPESLGEAHRTSPPLAQGRAVRPLWQFPTSPMPPPSQNPAALSLQQHLQEQAQRGGNHDEACDPRQGRLSEATLAPSQGSLHERDREQPRHPQLQRDSTWPRQRPNGVPYLDRPSLDEDNGIEAGRRQWRAQANGKQPPPNGVPDQRARLASTRGLVLMVTESAREAVRNKERCLTIARFCNKLHFICREVEVALGPQAMPDLLEAYLQVRAGCVVNMQRALELVRRAGSMGKCRLLIQAVNVSGEFKACTTVLGNTIAQLDKLRLPLPEDVREDLLHVQGQLWRLDFEVAKQNWELSALIRTEVQQLGKAPNGTSSFSQLLPLVQQVLQHAGLADLRSPLVQHELQAEYADVKAEAEAAQLQGQSEAAFFWGSILAALQALLQPGSEGAPSSDAFDPSNGSTVDGSVPPVPEEFLCPISLDIMTDPVIMIESAMTYDRSSIEQHFACGNEICPLSGRVLVNKRMIPNYNLKHAIENWCRQHRVSVAALAERSVVAAREQGLRAEPAAALATTTAADAGSAAEDADSASLLESGSQLSRCGSDSGLLDTAPPQLPDDAVGLITLLSQAARGRTSPEAVHAAARRVAELVDSNSQARAAVRRQGGIPVLVEQLKGSNAEEAARALWFMARDDENVTAITQASAISPLIQLLWGGTPDAKEAAARAFWNLSTYNEENKVAIAQAGAVPPLVHLLTFGSWGGKEAAAGALRSLAVNDDNEIEIVRAGAIPPLVALLAGTDEACKEVALGALHNLCSRSDWRHEIISAGGVKALREVAEASAPGRKPEVVHHARGLLKRML